MIIVCTSRSGTSCNFRSSRGGTSVYYRYGDMIESGNPDSVTCKILTNNGFTFITLGAYWRIATAIERDLFHMGNKNMDKMTKY